MARYKEEPIINPVPVVAPAEPTFSFNEYCANFSGHARNLDNAIKNWFMKSNSISDKKTITEWQHVINNFLNEKE